jgi:asparagine synthase (glutamine-hydrolysing)
MCGIAGSYSPRGEPPQQQRLEAALQRLERRGPDDQGIWHEEQVCLGQRRLAILDLSPAGHQPMRSSDGRYVVTFNGEIYNHLLLRQQLQPAGGWRGSCDTETLIEAYRHWGEDCLARLQGMFAFVIWDRIQQRLFAARDRLGVKPFYYRWSGGRFHFASRPGALLELTKGETQALDPDALRAYFDLGYIPAPLSLYSGSRKLNPGHFLVVDARGMREQCYWDFRSIAPDAALAVRSEEDLADELQALLVSAVRDRLLSDVPLGAFLSGGVDSAMVVAAMKLAGVAAPKTFTIAFDEEDFDEGPAAERIARHLGVEHIQEKLSVHQLLDLLPLYVEEYDEPFADSSAFPTLAVSRCARQQVKVVLTGDGADELFGGYHHYLLMQRLGRLTRMPRTGRMALQQALRMLPAHRMKLLAGALDATTAAGLFGYLRNISKDYPSPLLPEVLANTAVTADAFARTAAGFASDLSGAEIGMRLDAAYILPGAYLQKVDVATMAFSLEARCPMTDYRLVEWAMRLPLEYKLRGGTTKYLLKKVLARHLPAQMVYQPKKGFSVPLAQWLRGPLKGWSLELINDHSLMSRLPLSVANIRKLAHLHQSGRRETYPLLWSVLMLLCHVAHHELGRDIWPNSARRAA